METIVLIVENLKKSLIKEVIDKRMKEFETLGKKDSDDLFKELAFCLMTANFNAKKSIQIQEEIRDGFFTLPEKQLTKKLAELGHRFPNMRGKYICEARKCRRDLKKTLKSFKSEIEAREWLVKNIKGLGMKEASHFLRNIGYKNVAIIDFHIIDLLVREKLIEQPKSKSLTSKKYVEIENILRKIAEKTKTSLGELDLYLWYKETGTVLK